MRTLRLGALLMAVAALSAGMFVTHGSAAGDPIIAAAGDISCDPSNTNYKNGLGTTRACRQKWVSDMMIGRGLSAVLPLGDNQYYCGSLSTYQSAYEPSWGRLKAITSPTPGNHEYLTSGGTGCDATNAGAAGYFNYFGAAAGTVAAGKGYYSFDVGTWHVISLNTQCSAAGGCSASSPQGRWLAADLAAHTNLCTIAYWHVPLFSSGGRAAGASLPFWQLLYANQADVVLTGHDHVYERFAPQTPDGQMDTVHGLREWIAGTGGANHTSIPSVAANSEVRDSTTYGFLELALHASGYDWRFAADTGSGSFADAGTADCHDGPTPPTALTATAPAERRVDLSWVAAGARASAVTGYRVFRNGTEIGTTPTTSYSDTTVVASTTYSYTVVGVDAAGNTSIASAAASVTTPGAPDTTPPTAPTGLTATAATAAQIDLAWTAATDNVGVTGYRIFRNGVQVASTAGTTYSDKGLQPVTTYSYTVRAVDAAGNVSAASNTASATTPADPSPPTAPTGLTATAASSSQINLAWTASSDNVGVAGYRVWRDGVQVAVSPTPSYADTGLAAASTHTYVVYAYDAAGNVSPASNSVTATTLAAGQVLFMDGFETGNLAAWTTVLGVVAQQQLVGTGAWAARMTSTSAATYALETLPATYTEATYSVRFHVVSQGANNVNLVKFRDAGNVSLGAIYLSSSGTLSLRNDVAGVSTSGGVTVSLGAWHSLRWHVVVGGPTGSLAEVWLDGVKVDALTRADTFGTTPIGRIQLGESSTGRTYDVAYDDVQVATP
jgi:chitodextrinase